MLSRQASLSTIEADENSSTSSFDELVRSFNHRVAELQQLASVRLSDDCKQLFTRDIAGLEASVRAVESVYARINEHLDKEMASMSKASSLVSSFQQQAHQCQHIGANLPAHLPGHAAAAAGAAAAGFGSAVAAGSAAAAAAGAGGSNARAGAASTAAAAADAGGRKPLQPIQPAQPAAGKAAGGAGRAGREGRGKATAGSSNSSAAGVVCTTSPRWFVTASELDSLSSYIRGRATLTKVNAVLEEVALMAEVNARLMAAQRSNAPGAVPPQERRRAADLYFNVAMREGVRGCCWFLDSDLAKGVALKRDKSGTALLQLLRHLGRLKEVRVSLETMGATIVYVLQRPMG